MPSATATRASRLAAVPQPRRTYAARTRRSSVEIEIPTVPVATTDAPRSFLQTKPPSELHVDLASYILETTGLVVSPKAVQAVLSSHPEYQRSERNKSRPTYRPRLQEEEVVYVTPGKSARRNGRQR